MGLSPSRVKSELLERAASHVLLPFAQCGSERTGKGDRSRFMPLKEVALVPWSLKRLISVAPWLIIRVVVQRLSHGATRSKSCAGLTDQEERKPADRNRPEIDIGE
jgi:hypothetical protein